jgi:hypothetical protein
VGILLYLNVFIMVIFAKLPCVCAWHLCCVLAKQSRVYQRLSEGLMLSCMDHALHSSLHVDANSKHADLRTCEK